MKRIHATLLASALFMLVFGVAAWQSQQNFGGLPSGLGFSSPVLTVSGAGSGTGTIALAGQTSGTCNIGGSATSTTVTSQCGNFNVGVIGSAGGILGLNGATSGTATFAAPAVAGTATNPVLVSNSLQLASGTVYNWAGTTGLSAPTAGFVAAGNGTASDASAVFASDGNTVSLTADWTCGTGGTVASCTAATIVGSGGGVPLTFTLPLVARSWTWECDLVVGQATAATANQWNILTATTGATNITAYYDMYTAATAKAGGAVTDQASTTTTFQIAPSWTLGGTATKMPVHIWGRVEGASASGTVISLQLLAPTVGDLVTIYRGGGCRIR